MNIETDTHEIKREKVIIFYTKSSKTQQKLHAPKDNQMGIGRRGGKKGTKQVERKNVGQGREEGLEVREKREYFDWDQREEEGVVEVKVQVQVQVQRKGQQEKEGCVVRP